MGDPAEVPDAPKPLQPSRDDRAMEGYASPPGVVEPDGRRITWEQAGNYLRVWRRWPPAKVTSANDCSSGCFGLQASM